MVFRKSIFENFMKNNNEQIQEKVLKVLKNNYGFDIVSINFIPVGQESYSYVATTTDGKKIFVKYCEEIGAVNNINNVNNLLLELKFLEFVIPPIVMGGKTSFDLGKGKVYVYPYVEGQVIHMPNDKFDKKLIGKLTEIMSDIHTSSQKIKTELPREDFNYDFMGKYRFLTDIDNKNKFELNEWELLLNNKEKNTQVNKQICRIG